VSLNPSSVTGYTFSNWLVTGATNTGVSPNCAFTMPANNVTAVARYSINLHTLNVQSTPMTGLAITGSSAGTTNYSTGQTVAYNTSVSLTAPSVTGYNFTDGALARFRQHHHLLDAGYGRDGRGDLPGHQLQPVRAVHAADRSGDHRNIFGTTNYSTGSNVRSAPALR